MMISASHRLMNIGEMCTDVGEPAVNAKARRVCGLLCSYIRGKKSSAEESYENLVQGAVV